MISVIIKTYFPCFLAILWLLFFLLQNKVLGAKVARIFFLFLSALVALIVSDAIDLFLSIKGDSSFFRYVVTAVGYGLRIGIIELMTMLVRRHSPRLKLAGMIPLIIFLIIAFTSYFTKWLFYYDETGSFLRGGLSWLPFAICALYFFRLELTAIQDYKNDASEAAFILIIALSCIAASVVDTFAGFAYYLDVTITVDIVFYYVFQLIQVYRRDPLTDILNRRSFYQDAKLFSKRNCIIISIDMNNLKQINDEHGHAAGDQALLVVTDCMQKTFKPKGRVYRIGGDEFMVLCPLCDTTCARTLLQTYNALLSKTPYSVACGYAEYIPGLDFEQVLAEADKQMYQNKSLIKAALDAEADNVRAGGQK